MKGKVSFIYTRNVTVTYESPYLKLLIRVVRRQRLSPGGNHHLIAAKVKVS